MGRLSPEVLNQIPATIAEATAAEASEEEVEGN